MIQFFLIWFFLMPASPEYAWREQLSIQKLTDNTYIFTTWKTLNETTFPSNGIYIVADTGVIMIDTPWDTLQVEPLLDSIKKRHNKKVLYCIATHFHEDRTGGFDILKRKGIKTYSSLQTLQLCRNKNEKQAQRYFKKDTVFTSGKILVETFYPGHGHTEDNIVLWIKNEKILYGGCFVKSIENNSLGNIADANPEEWKKSLTKTIQKFPKPKYIIPGHFGWQSTKALKHTLKLIGKLLQQ